MKNNIKIITLFLCFVWSTNFTLASNPITSWTGHPNVNTSSAPNFYKSGWGWNIGGFISSVKIPSGQDGFIEHTFTNVSNRYYIVGLSENDPSYPTTTTALDYAWYINPTVVQTRVPALNAYVNYPHPSTQTKVLRIEKVGSTVYFKLNGSVVNTYSIDPNKDYYVGGMINSGGTNTIPISYSVSSVMYAKLTHKLNGNYYHTNGDNFYFKYFEEYKDGNLDFAVYDQNNSKVGGLTSTQLYNKDSAVMGGKIYGSNRFRLDVSSLINNQYYILEVTNDKEETLKLKFLKVSFQSSQ